PELGTFVLTLVQPNESTVEVRFRRTPTERRERDTPAAREVREERHVDTVHLEDAHELPEALVAILTQAVSRGASDVHASPHGASLVRINGELQLFENVAPVDATALLDGEAAQQRLREGRSVDRAFTVPGVGRVRVNVYATDEGLCAAVRILR